jgi:hypothetical protein
MKQPPYSDHSLNIKCWKTMSRESEDDAMTGALDDAGRRNLSPQRRRGDESCKTYPQRDSGI